MPTSSYSRLCLSFHTLLIFVLLLTGSATAQDANTQSAAQTGGALPSAIAPTLSNIFPASGAAGGAGFTLTLSGSNFLPTSVVRWNGVSRPVTYDSEFQLRAQISAQDIQSLGSNSVTVFNSGAGSSSPVAFTTYLPLATNDLVYDATRGVLWASIPSTGGPLLGNSIVSVNPYTGVLGMPLWVGSEPGKLALSTDASTLWIALRGSPSIRKVSLITMTLSPVQPYFPGGWGSNVYANSLAVAPGSASTVAVAAGFVTIYDNAVARANAGTTGANSLAFGATSSTLYGYGYGGGLSIFTVGATGITNTKTPPNSGSYSNDLRYDKGRLYLTSGQVLDGTTGNLLGKFAAPGPVAPDSKLGRAFTLNSSSSFGTPDQVTAFDINTFLPLGSFGVGGLDTSFNSPSSLVRWGDDGLAFRTEGSVYILRSPTVQNLSATPADISVSSTAPAASTTGTNTLLNFTVKNIGPTGVSHVTLLETFTLEPIVVSAVASQGNCAAGPVVRCDCGSLATGGTASVSISIIPVGAGSLKTTATVGSSLPDPKPGNNKITKSITITGPAYNAVPVLTALSPSSALLGSPTLSLTVSGANYNAGSTVNWNGAALPTTFVSKTQLSATVDVNLLKAFNSARITVTNAAPGGGVSGTLPFSVFRSVSLDANDIVFDPFTRKLYASVPSTATQVAGNSIVSIDPLTGKLGKAVFIGSEPTRMGISDDGQFLYTVLAGSNAVRRLNLTNLTAGTQFTTVSSLFGAFTASDVSVMPGNRNAVATVGYSDGIQLWDVTNTGATPRKSTLVNSVYEGSVLAWGSPTSLYSNDEGLSPSSLHRFAVQPTSFAETDSTYLDAVGGKITFSGGLLFSDGGGVVDPSPASPDTPHLVGRIMAGGSSAVDTSINRAFYLDQNSYGVNSRLISAFDSTHFVSAGSVYLDNLTGDAFDLIRWGGDGLAFRTATDFWGNGSGRVILVHGSFVLPPSPLPNPIPAITTLSPASVTSPGANTWVTITGARFVPGSVAYWNGSARSTVFVNATTLRVAIPAADLVVPVAAKLRVNNPVPGGGNSATLTLTVK